MKKLTRQITLALILIGFSLANSYASIQSLPSGVQEGINYIDNNTVILVLLAPGKRSAKITGTFNNWALTEMNKTPNGEHFWIELNNLTAGQEYIYQYLVDDAIRISDPFAEKILDPYNDHEIPSSTYPNLIQWTDKAKGLASVFQTGQAEYQWQVPNFQGPLKHHLIAYELLIRDFTEERSFQSVIDSMSYFKRLGINALELMPVNEFDANLSWGYNPSHYFAVDKFYGPKQKLQELVDVAHQNGIAVIIDMVYNHTMNQSPLASLYWNASSNRPASNNPWYNETAPHHSTTWGNDFNHESHYTRNFFDRVSKFWIEEFNIDGFRFDFTKGMTQKETWNDSDMSNYDNGRISNIKRMANEIWNEKNNAYIILEHWGQENEENELVAHGNGMLTWRKLHHNYAKILSGNDLYNQSIGGAQSDTRMIFMESHDEERIPFDVTKKLGNEQTMMDRMKLGAAFLYTIPGPKMIWMFEELACNYSLFTCADGSVQYNDGCKLASKPFVWKGYMADPKRVEVYKIFSKLLKLRKENDAFTLGYYEIDENGDGIPNNGLGSLRQIRIKHASMDIVIIGNFGTSGGNINPWFTKNGTWHNYFNKDYPTYNYNGQTSYYLKPGQWELFTSVKIEEYKLNAPSNLSTVVTGSNATINWMDNSDDEVSFRIERSQSASSDFTPIVTVPANSQLYTDSSLADGKYYYRVQAIGSANTYSKYSNITSVQIGESKGIKVHFKNTANWNKVKIYVFDWITKNGIPNWTWPGLDMTQELSSPWYSYIINEDVTPGIVFNNGAGLKTEDLSCTSEGWYDFSTQQWHNQCPGDCPGNSPTGLTVHLKKPLGWGAATLYFWNTTGASLISNWPGVQMSDPDEDGWFSYTLANVVCANVIFSNNGATKTNDLVGICNESWYDNGWVANPGLKSANSIVEVRNLQNSAPFPNPFSNKITINSSGFAGEVKLNIVALNGSTVFMESLQTTGEVFSIQPKIASGVYILHLTSNAITHAYRIIKY